VMKSEEAIVLVGGFGTRLRSLVSDVPKPLAPVAGRPFLAWVLDSLSSQGIRRVILGAGYMADKVEQVIGQSWNGMDIVYSIEEEPLGTGGAVRQACGFLQGSDVHVINGDTFVRYAPNGLSAAVREKGAALGVVLAPMGDVARYGAVERDGDLVSAFLEKGRAGPGYINAGCYYLTDAAIAALPTLEKFSLESDFLVPQVQAGHVLGYSNADGFIDIGVPEDYLRAQTMNWMTA
jgi:D-glycero-alpha-D-manno-heptose 1-phosphate guanylyltransferase